MRQLQRGLLILIVFAMSVWSGLAQDNTIAMGDEISMTAAGTAVEYVLQLTTGDAVTVNLTSDDFDPVLSVEDPAGEVIAENDDFEGSFEESQVTFTAEVDGAYMVLVNSFLGNPEGDFTLAVTTASQAAGEGAEEETPIPLLTVQSELRVGDSLEVTVNEEDVFYTLALQEGQEVTVNLTSEDFDTYLTVFQPDGEIVAFNDDFEGSRQRSQVTFVAPVSGEYEVAVEAFVGFPSGTFTLAVSGDEVSEVPAATTEDPEFVAIGDELTIIAEQSDLEYELTVQEASEITIDLRSESFDTTLTVLDAEGKEVAANDDFLGSTSQSQVTFPAEAGMTYTVVVGSFIGEPTGEFTLRVVDADGTVAVANDESIQVGETLEIPNPNQETLSVFMEVAEEQLLSIGVTALDGTSDLVLTVFGETGQEITSNDDDGGNLNPLVRSQLFAPGTYELSIRTFGGTPIVTDVQVSVNELEVLTANNEPTTFTLSNDTSVEVLIYELEAETRYEIIVESVDVLTNTLFVEITAPGEFFGGTTFSASGTNSMQIAYQTGEAGPTEFSFEYFTSSDVEFTLTIREVAQ